MKRDRSACRRRAIGKLSREVAGFQIGSHPLRVAGARFALLAALLTFPHALPAAASDAAAGAEGSSPPPAETIRASAPGQPGGRESPAPEGAPSSALLRERLKGPLGRVVAAAPAGIALGVAVLSGETGEVLYEKGGRQPLIPASNAKIFTVAAALDRLGPDFAFRTEVLGAGPPAGEVLEGSIVLRGAGDPSLTTEDLWGLALDLEALGIRRIAGDLILDDSAFDRVQAPAAGDARYRDRPYGALTSALTSNFNTIAVEVAPGPRGGQPARVVTVPPMEGVRVANETRTGGGGGNGGVLSVSVSEPPEGAGPAGEAAVEVVTVRGNVPPGAPPRRIWRSVGRPARLTGQLFKTLLRRADISLQGKVRMGPAPPGYRVLAGRDSAPLAVLLRDVGKRSNNLYAEQILKALSETRPGSTRGGIAAVESWMKEIGIGSSGTRVADGSGLSRQNRATPLDLARALRAGAGNPLAGAEFRSAFAVAGVDGTLEKRLTDLRGRVRGKTGYLTGVSALSGWVTTTGGAEVFFAIVANKTGADPSGAKALQDRIVRTIAEAG